MALKYHLSLQVAYMGDKDAYREVFFAPSNYLGVSILQEEHGAYPLLLVIGFYPELRNLLLTSYGLQPSLLREGEAIDLLWLLLSAGIKSRFTLGADEYLPLETLQQRLLATLSLTAKQQRNVLRYSRGVTLFTLLTKQYVPHGYGPWSAGEAADILVTMALARKLIYHEEGEWRGYPFSLSSFTSWHEVSPIDAIAAYLAPSTLSSIADKYGMTLPNGSVWLRMFTLLYRLEEYRTMLLRPVLPLPPPLNGEVFPPLSVVESTEVDPGFEKLRQTITLSVYSDWEINAFYGPSLGSHWWYNPDYPGVLTYGIPHTDPSLQMRSSQIYTARELEASSRVYSGPLGCRVRRFLVPRGGSPGAFSSVPSFNIYALSELWSMTSKITDDHDIVSLHQYLTAQLQARRRENWSIVPLLEKPRSEETLEILADIFLQGMQLRGWLGPGHDWAYNPSLPQSDVPLLRKSLDLPLLAFDWFTGFISMVGTQPTLSLANLAFRRSPPMEIGEILVNTAYAHLCIRLANIEQVHIHLYEGARRLKRLRGIEAPIYYEFLPSLMR